jgi:hypothetical protein
LWQHLHAWRMAGGVWRRWPLVGEGGGAARLAASAVSSQGLAARGRLTQEKLRGAWGGHVRGFRQRRDGVRSRGDRWHETVRCKEHARWGMERGRWVAR